MSSPSMLSHDVSMMAAAVRSRRKVPDVGQISDGLIDRRPSDRNFQLWRTPRNQLEHSRMLLREGGSAITQSCDGAKCGRYGGSEGGETDCDWTRSEGLDGV